MTKKKEKNSKKIKQTYTVSKERKEINAESIIEGKGCLDVTIIKGVRNIPNPYLVRNKCKPFREDALQIENKKEIITVPVVLDLLTMRSQYFNDLFSSIREDSNKKGLVVTIPEDNPLVAAELIIELHKLVPDFSEWNYQWVQLSEKWQMQQVCDIYQQLCAKKLTVMLQTLKTMEMMNSVLIVMSCESSDAIGMYQYQCTDDEKYYVKKISPKEEYRIFQQKVYSTRNNFTTCPHHPHHQHLHHQHPMHDEESVSVVHGEMHDFIISDDEDSSSESDSSADASSESDAIGFASIISLPAVPDPNSTAGGTSAVRIQQQKSVWCHGLFSTNATSTAHEFSLAKVLFARSKPSFSSSNSSSSSRVRRDGSEGTFTVEDQWTRVNEKYSGMSMNAKMKVLTLGCRQRESGLSMLVPAIATNSSSSSSSNPQQTSNAVNVSTSSITPIPTSSSSSSSSHLHSNLTSNSNTTGNKKSDSDSTNGEIIDVKLFWELARYWMRGDDRPKLGDVATESELMEQVWEYKDILLREQIQDAVISALGKRKRSVSP